MPQRVDHALGQRCWAQNADEHCSQGRGRPARPWRLWASAELHPMRRPPPTCRWPLPRTPTTQRVPLTALLRLRLQAR